MMLLLGVGIFFALQAGFATAVDMGSEVPVRGVIRSVNQATLSNDIRASVVKMRFREGERFTKGDVLVEFDCRQEQARLAAAEALLKEKSVTLKNARYLQGLKAGSTQEVQISEAQVEQVVADIAALQARLDGCILTAPYDGVVYKTHVRQNEMPAEGAPVISIVDTANPEIELIVSSNWIKAMTPGRKFQFKVDETGETHAAIVRRAAPVVDPVSQTVKVYAQFVEPDVPVLPGMSGDARFDLDWELR